MQPWGYFILSLYVLSVIQLALYEERAPRNTLRAVFYVLATITPSWFMFVLNVLTSESPDWNANVATALWFVLFLGAVDAMHVRNFKDVLFIAVTLALCSVNLKLENSVYIRAFVTYRLISAYYGYSYLFTICRGVLTRVLLPMDYELLRGCVELFSIAIFLLNVAIQLYLMFDVPHAVSYMIILVPCFLHDISIINDV